MTARAPLGPLLRAFFADHLLQQKAVSPQTIHAYRDAFRLLLTFLEQHRQRKPEVLTLDDLDAPVILAFLDHLEEDRANSIASRNARLGAVRSFVRFAALRTPECVDLTSRVLAIPRKRTPRRQVAYLTRAEMDAILAGCDRSTHGGRRDHALLLTLYNTGARVSELIAVRHSHVRFGATAVVQLFGKGRKERAVPLWTRTSRCLRQWFDEEGEAAPDYAFRNARGDRLTRQGVTHLLDQACQRASERCPSLDAKRVSPHVVRHTTAMHLLQAGVDMATIALWLGHERLETTHQYVEADLQLKEDALRKLEPLGQRTQRFKADSSLLAFLGVRLFFVERFPPCSWAFSLAGAPSWVRRTGGQHSPPPVFGPPEQPARLDHDAWALRSAPPATPLDIHAAFWYVSMGKEMSLRWP